MNLMIWPPMPSMALRDRHNSWMTQDRVHHGRSKSPRMGPRPNPSRPLLLSYLQRTIDHIILLKAIGIHKKANKSWKPDVSDAGHVANGHLGSNVGDFCFRLLIEKLMLVQQAPRTAELMVHRRPLGVARAFVMAG